MYKIVFDSRWNGEHGIGRFSREIHNRIKFDSEINGKTSPTSPFDIFITPWYLLSPDKVFFTPGFNAPWWFVSRSIITIHDLNHIDVKGNNSLLKTFYYNWVLKRACKKCIKIFTVSEFSKSRIVEWSNILPDKVVVVGNGVSMGFKPSGELHLPGYEYFLCVSNRKEHKNEKRLINAFSQLDRSQGVKLLFTGHPTDDVLQYIRKEGLESDILFSGRIDENELPKYYRGAKAVLMPSLYEGFGLPVIEAMACGVPVMASNTTALREVAQGFAVTVDPYSVKEISAGMNMLLTDNVLRNELIAKGLDRARMFSWDKTVHLISSELDMILTDNG